MKPEYLIVELETRVPVPDEFYMIEKVRFTDNCVKMPHSDSFTFQEWLNRLRYYTLSRFSDKFQMFYVNNTNRSIAAIKQFDYYNKM